MINSYLLFRKFSSGFIKTGGISTFKPFFPLIYNNTLYSTYIVFCQQSTKDIITSTLIYFCLLKRQEDQELSNIPGNTALESSMAQKATNIMEKCQGCGEHIQEGKTIVEHVMTSKRHNINDRISCPLCGHICNPMNKRMMKGYEPFWEHCGKKHPWDGVDRKLRCDLPGCTTESFPSQLYKMVHIAGEQWHGSRRPLQPPPPRSPAYCRISGDTPGNSLEQPPSESPAHRDIARDSPEKSQLQSRSNLSNWGKATKRKAAEKGS